MGDAARAHGPRRGRVRDDSALVLGLREAGPHSVLAAIRCSDHMAGCPPADLCGQRADPHPKPPMAQDALVPAGVACSHPCVGLAAASEQLPVALRPQSSGPAWQHVYPIAPIVLAIALALALRQLPWRKMAKGMLSSNTADDSGITWREIEAWIDGGERPITGGERDLFQHRRIAARIARSVVADRRHVALLGRFGSGKSSILNLVTAELAQSPGTWVVADFDVWAVPNPEDVPRLALNRIVSALDDFVDTIQFRSLPLAYQRLASAEPSGRLSAAIGLESAADSIELLEGLSKASRVN